MDLLAGLQMRVVPPTVPPTPRPLTPPPHRPTTASIPTVRFPQTPTSWIPYTTGNPTPARTRTPLLRRLTEHHLAEHRHLLRQLHDPRSRLRQRNP